MNESTAIALWKQNDASTLDLYLSIYNSNVESEVVSISRQIAPSVNSVEKALKLLGTVTVKSIFQTAIKLSSQKTLLK